MIATLRRVTQRHLTPAFVTTIYYYLKYRCFVNMKARAQLTSRISFGKRCTVKAFAIIQTSGGRIDIGENCSIGNFNHISTDAGNIKIGDNVRFGPHVTLLGMTSVYRKKDRLIVDQGYTSKGIVIGDDVFIGAGAIILDGCKIGDGAVIGVGSVVNKSIEPYAITFGAPVKTIFKRS